MNCTNKDNAKRCLLVGGKDQTIGAKTNTLPVDGCYKGCIPSKDLSSSVELPSSSVELPSSSVEFPLKEVVSPIYKFPIKMKID